MDELERLTQQLFEDDWAVAREQYGPLATTDNLPRTATQRRADALVIMATRSGTMTAAGGRPPRPLFVVMTDLDTTLKICQMADGTVIAPKLLASWFTQAEFERFVFDTPKRVIEVGVKKRFFTGAVRRAIEVRDQHCTFPGCTVSANRCDIDHVIEYSQGGPPPKQTGASDAPPTTANAPAETPHHPKAPKPARVWRDGIIVVQIPRGNERSGVYQHRQRRWASEQQPGHPDYYRGRPWVSCSCSSRFRWP